MASEIKLLNAEGDELKIVHPNGAGDVTLNSNEIASKSYVDDLGALKLNTTAKAADADKLDGYNLDETGVPLYRGFMANGWHTTIGNLNTIAVNSIYNHAENATGTPLAQWGFVHTMVHASGSNWRTQMWYPMQNNSGTVYQRAMADGTNWSAWNRTGVEATGAAPAYACRAWVNFNGTGTVAIRASGNVSSITDDGTGNYTVNFTTAMPDANYSVTGMNKGFSPDDGASIWIKHSTTPSTTFVNILTGQTGRSGQTALVYYDIDFNNIAIFR